MTKSRMFFILALSFILGIFAASFFASIASSSLLLVLAAGAVAIFILNYKNKKAVVLSIAVLFFALGAWRSGSAIEDARNNLAKKKTGPADFQAIIIREPEISEKIQNIKVSVLQENTKTPNQIQSSIPVYWTNKIFDKNKKTVLLNADIFPKYEYGDRLQVNCVLEEPENFDEKFDYQMYLAKDGIYRVCNRPKIMLVGKNQGSKIYSAILSIKKRFEVSLSAIFPDPEGAYLKGLLLGGSDRMTKDLADAFSKTGTTHTVAVSGYNVTIVAAFLMEAGILIGLWRQQVFSFALLGIILFVLATGAPSSAVRAGIMGGLVIWAMKEGRLANSQNAILAAAAAMLAINPLLFRYDVGFQLSFLATLGIVYLSPIFEKFFERKVKVNIMKEAFFLSIAAQIFVLPVILSNFENLSIISPLANLIILPAIPYIMFGGFVAGLVGLIFIPLGKIVGFAPYILLKFELYIVQKLAALPWASLEIKNFGWKQMSVYYILLAGIYYFSQKKKPDKAGFG